MQHRLDKQAKQLRELSETLRILASDGTREAERTRWGVNRQLSDNPYT